MKQQPKFSKTGWVIFVFVTAFAWELGTQMVWMLLTSNGVALG